MRILWLKTELLHPIDKGGKIRTYFMLRELKRQHHITYLTLDDGAAGGDAVARASEYADELIRIPFAAAQKFSPGFYRDLAMNLVSPLPYFLSKYRSAEMRRAIVERVARGGVDVLVCDFLMPAVNLPEELPCPTVLFQHNVEAMIWRRHYEVQSNPLEKLYLWDQWRKSRSYERTACHRFDQVVAVSTEDRDLMRAEYGLDVVDAVPTGVDTNYFQPDPAVRRNPRELVFTGSMDWLPNVDAVRWFVAEVLPRIRAELPDVRLTVVGRDPHPDVLALAEEAGGIEVTGRVEDVRPYMNRAAAYVIPIRIGGGTRLKVYEAMAMEVPIISTTVGAEGLPVAHGDHLLIADEASAFGREVVRVLTDPGLGPELAGRAAATVRERYGWSVVATAFERLCRVGMERWAERTDNAVQGGRAAAEGEACVLS